MPVSVLVVRRKMVKVKRCDFDRKLVENETYTWYTGKYRSFSVAFLP
jgi:hypothetical protein